MNSAWEGAGWEDVTTLLGMESDAGYNWNVIQLISRPHGDTVQYAVYADGGCSCNSPRDMGVDSYNLVWRYDFMDARREAERTVYSYSDYAFSPAQKFEFLAGLRKVKP